MNTNSDSFRQLNLRQWTMRVWSIGTLFRVYYRENGRDRVRIWPVSHADQVTLAPSGGASPPQCPPPAALPSSHRCLTSAGLHGGWLTIDIRAEVISGLEQAVHGRSGRQLARLPARDGDDSFDIEIRALSLAHPRHKALTISARRRFLSRYFFCAEPEVSY